MADEGALVSVSGRKVFTDKKTGEKYSERTTTVPVNGKWYTFPTIKEDGTQMSEDEVVEYIKEKGPIDPITGEEFPSFENVDKAVEYAKARSATRLKDGYATGGEVQQMKKMYKEGGLATDGMEVDPVSGNEIPVGSNASDVRDDVDVKLSKGEYVVPADVVKYIGVSTLEKMVNKAKEGLEEMSEDGRIGGEPVADPDAKEDLLEYTLSSDLDILDGYASGGLVPGADVNNAVDRIKGAAAKDPSVLNMLKAKGIFIKDAGPQAQPADVQGMAEGGVVGDGTYRSSFNPGDYGMGFSYTGKPLTKSEAAKEEPAVDYETEADKPTEPVIKPGDEDAGGPDPDTDNDSNGGWMGGFDYTDPDTLAEQTMSTLSSKDESTGGKALGLAGTVFGGITGKGVVGLVGKAIAGSTYSNAMANASALAANGHVAQSAQVTAAAKSFAEANNVNTKGFFTSGLNNKSKSATDAMTNTAPKGARATSTSRSTTTRSSLAPVSSAVPPAGRPSYSSIAENYRGQGTNVGDQVASYAEEAARTGGSIADVSRSGPGGYDNAVGQGTAGQASGGAQQGGTGSVGLSGNDGKGNGVSGTSDGEVGAPTGGQGDQGKGSGWGGMYKGGLVAPRPSKKKMEKKPTVKKGLGRR